MDVPRPPSAPIDVTRHTAPAAWSDLPAPSASTGSTSLDLDTPAPPTGSASLDLSTPTAPAPTGSTSLDFSAPSAPSRPSGPTLSTSLDLSTPAPPPASHPHRASSSGRERPPRPSAANGDEVLVWEPRRTTPGRPTTLGPPDPTVALTRLQSGVGVLTIRAAAPASVGDLRLAVAYRLRTGESSLLCAARGAPVAPPHSRRPVISGTWEGQETLRVDLRQVTAVERFVVLAFSQSGTPLAWGGALVVETVGGARLDVPLDHPPAAGVLVALSVHAVVGELVLRAEDELLVGGTLRDATVAHGFDITWVDAWTALA